MKERVNLLNVVKQMPKKTNAICVQQAGSKRNRNDYSEDRNILAENI